MEKLVTCGYHNRLLEIYCKACRSYLCVCCLDTHEEGKHVDSYVHVLKHSADTALNKVDALLQDISKKESELNSSAQEFAMGLESIATSLQDVSNLQAKQAQMLASLATQMETSLQAMQQQPLAQQLRLGLISEKRRLETAVLTKDLRTTITLLKKMDVEVALASGPEAGPPLASRIQEGVKVLPSPAVYKNLIEAVQLLLCKCQALSTRVANTDWTCDPTLLSSKMTLSTDRLVFGNNAGAGYPAIIGTKSFDTGILAFEVIPSGFCCSGKEDPSFLYLPIYTSSG